MRRKLLFGLGKADADLLVIVILVLRVIWMIESDVSFDHQIYYNIRINFDG
jgi:hypothetical protein